MSAVVFGFRKKSKGIEPIRIHNPSSKLTLQHAQENTPKGRIENHDLNEYDLYLLEKDNGDHPSWWPLILVVGFLGIVKGMQGFSIYNRIRHDFWPYIVDIWLNIEAFFNYLF